MFMQELRAFDSLTSNPRLINNIVYCGGGGLACYRNDLTPPASLHVCAFARAIQQPSHARHLPIHCFGGPYLWRSWSNVEQHLISNHYLNYYFCLLIYYIIFRCCGFVPRTKMQLGRVSKYVQTLCRASELGRDQKGVAALVKNCSLIVNCSFTVACLLCTARPHRSR